MKLLVVTVIISFIVAGQCGRTEVEESYLDYPYEKVFDYYVIRAWYGLNDTVPAYTPEMIARHTQLVLDLPWAGPTPSAEDDGVLGQTPGWSRERLLESGKNLALALHDVLTADKTQE